MVLDVGTRSRSLSTDRKFRLWTIEILVNTSLRYSGARPCKALYTVVHVWYWTRLGKVNHFSSLNISSEGVSKSACSINLAAFFFEVLII